MIAKSLWNAYNTAHYFSNASPVPCQFRTAAGHEALGRPRGRAAGVPQAPSAAVERPVPIDDSSRLEQYSRLLASCQRPVFLYAMSLLHHAADAEEVLQQTNLVLWRKLDEYDSRMDFVKWACGIAHLETLKIRQQRPRERRFFSDEFIARIAVRCQQSIDDLDHRREALAGCLQKLGESDRRLVLDRYQPEATTASVAASAGRSVQGTRKTLRRIRAALLSCVERTLKAEAIP
jgi:RNA polymerase sigma-70 factor, ECF subfamily